MTVGSVVPVAIVASIGALASLRAVRLAWTGENKLHRKLFLSLLLLVELVNLLVPLGAFNQWIRTYQHRSVFSLAAFLAALHFQELFTLIVSYSKTWSIYSEYKSAGMLPEYFSYWQNRFGYDRLFKRPLLLIALGLVLGFFVPAPYGQIVAFLGVFWFARIASFLSSVYPEDLVLNKISKSWRWRLVLTLVVYLVVAPLALKAIGVKFVDPESQQGKEEVEESLKQNLAAVDQFLTTYAGIAVAVLLLVYKLVVLATVGGVRVRQCGWNCHVDAAAQHQHPAAWFAPAEGAAAGVTAGVAAGAAGAAGTPEDLAADPEQAEALPRSLQHPRNSRHHRYGYPGADADQSVVEPLAPSAADAASIVVVPHGVPVTAAPSTAASARYAFYA